MKTEFISGSEFARLCGVSRQAIDAARKVGTVHRDDVTKKYDLTNKTNSAYYELSTVQQTQKQGSEKPEDLPEDLRSMAAAKLAAEVRRVEATALKLELANEIQAGRLMDVKMIDVFMGAIAAANRDFFLPLGKSLSKGDPQLQERIEKAVSKALYKSRAAAGEAVKNYSQICIAEKEAENES